MAHKLAVFCGIFRRSTIIIDHFIVYNGCPREVTSASAFSRWVN